MLHFMLGTMVVQRLHTCFPSPLSVVESLTFRVNSFLTMVSSLQYRTLTKCMLVMLSSASETTCYNMTYTVLRETLKPDLIIKIAPHAHIVLLGIKVQVHNSISIL